MNLRTPVSMIVLVISIMAGSVRAKEDGYHVARKVGIPGAATYYDYLLFDPGSRRLYVSFGEQVAILDGDKNAVVGALVGAKKVHGMAVANDRVFVSDGGSDRVRVYEARTQTLLGEVKTGKNPDAIMYDSGSKQVFAFNHSGGSVTVIDPASLKAKATIEVPGALEMGRSDGKGTLWVNVEDRSEIARIDTRTNTVTARWRLEPCEEPTGLAFDPKTRRLFAGCNNKLLAVVNADTGAVITTLPIGPGVDGAEFDPGTKTIFASCGGDGTLAVIKQESADKYSAVTNVATQTRARTLTFDPKTHRVFLSAASFTPAPAGSKARGAMVPGSFNVLIVEP
jgi:DNA-binding beta-propeller fold protein YncE